MLQPCYNFLNRAVPVVVSDLLEPSIERSRNFGPLGGAGAALRGGRPLPLTPSSLNREAEFDCLVDATLLRLEIVDEEIAIQCSLHHTANPDDNLRVVVLMEVAVHPVEQVEETVHAEHEHVVGRNVLAEANLLQHEQLRNDRHRLKVD